MSPNPQSAFQLLVVALALMTVLVLVMLLYLRGWWRLRVALPKAISRWQLGVFMCGMIALGTAVGSALAALDHRLLLMHMILHILLMAIAPPLILLGAPYLVFAQALPASFILAVDPILRWRPMQRLENFLVKPLLCGFIATAVLVGWHFPAAFDFGMKSGSRHAIECASFFAAGIFFW
jgi:cytochrome c oxidase assembly factor CtaG